MIIFLYLILVLAWALLIIILKCKKARAKRLAEQDELAHAGGPVHVVQIGSNLYDIMSLHRDNYSGVYSCLEHGTIAQHRHQRAATTSVTHSNSAFVGDDGSIYPGNGMVTMEPPPSYDEVIRLPAYYPKVETFVPEMVVPPTTTTTTSPRAAVPSHQYYHHHPHYHHHHQYHQPQQQQPPPSPPVGESLPQSTGPAIMSATDGDGPTVPTGPSVTDAAPPLDTNGNRIKSVPVGVHHPHCTTPSSTTTTGPGVQTPAVGS
uniref:Putative secreted protein n=1 Tax=Anopheles marajoara TaxID=58244 RepID=A0A2M4BX36_9DIPT